MNRTYSESLRFPAVERPARVVVRKRDAANAFKDVWSFEVDPADKFIVKGRAKTPPGALIKLHERGDPATKLDLLIIGDGYTAAQRGKFRRDADRLLKVLSPRARSRSARTRSTCGAWCPRRPRAGSAARRRGFTSGPRLVRPTMRSTPNATS